MYAKQRCCSGPELHEAHTQTSLAGFTHTRQGPSQTLWPCTCQELGAPMPHNTILVQRGPHVSLPHGQDMPSSCVEFRVWGGSPANDVGPAMLTPPSPAQVAR